MRVFLFVFIASSSLRLICMFRELRLVLIFISHVYLSETHLADNHADDVFRLPRRRVPEKIGQQTDLSILASFAGFASDCSKVFVDLRGRQRRRLERLLAPRGNRLLRDKPVISLILTYA